MKVVCVQFSPIFKGIQENLAEASKRLESLTADSNVDLVVLPEMIFTGYCFTGKEDILPFCTDIDMKEDFCTDVKEASKDFCIQWALEKSQLLNCWIQFGFPRKEGSFLYNSICLISPPTKTNPSSHIHAVYDKTHLYETDETWATEGSGFKAVQMNIDSSITAGFAICMDFNPKQFKAPFDAYEMASFYRDNNASLLICSMAWLMPTELFINPDKSVEYNMINYWALRLSPLIDASKSNGRIVNVIICNRTGKEGETVFGGTSCILQIKEGRIHLLGSLPCNQDGILSIDL